MYITYIPWKEDGKGVTLRRGDSVGLRKLRKHTCIGAATPMMMTPSISLYNTSEQGA